MSVAIALVFITVQEALRSGFSRLLQPSNVILQYRVTQIVLSFLSMTCPYPDSAIAFKYSVNNLGNVGRFLGRSALQGTSIMNGARIASVRMAPVICAPATKSLLSNYFHGVNMINAPL